MILLGFLLGLLAGSFLNVVIVRLPLSLLDKSMNIAQPMRSFCPKCRHKLGAWELIPIFSFLWQKGKCKHCKKPISWQYPLVELSAAFLSAGVVFAQGFALQTGFYLLFVYFLLALFVLDFKNQLLPDVLTLPLLWLGLIFHIVDNNHGISLADGVIGALVGYLLLWSIFWLFKLIYNKQGMGYGDFKLLAALGAWLGWQMLPQLLMIASLSGIVFFLIRRYDKNQKIAFGPFLILSASILLGFEWLIF